MLLWTQAFRYLFLAANKWIEVLLIFCFSKFWRRRIISSNEAVRILCPLFSTPFLSLPGRVAVTFLVNVSLESGISLLLFILRELFVNRYSVHHTGVESLHVEILYFPSSNKNVQSLCPCHYALLAHDFFDSWSIVLILLHTRFEDYRQIIYARTR